MTKQKWMKKVSASILATALVISSFGDNSKAFAAENEVVSAKDYIIGEQETGMLDNSEDVDYYSFTTDGSDSFYELSFVNTEVDGDVYYEIYKDADLVDEVVSNCVIYKESDYYNFVKLEKNHTYYVKIYGSNTGYYQFKVTKTEDDVKDTAAEAKKIGLNTINSFVLQNERDVDFFKVETTNYVNYTLSFSNVTIDGDAYIQVFSGKDCLDNQIVFDQSLGYKSSLTKSEASLKLKCFKTYYIKINGVKGNYKIGVSATAPASIKVANSKNKKVTVKWKKISGATGYEIYRAQGKNGKYNKIKTIKKAGIETYIDKKGLKKGETYFYKIRAYNKVNGKTYYTGFTSAKSTKIK